jgi:hypothetical protein
VLVYADIGMDPLSYFLAFSRLAPAQCAMLGHPVTIGNPQCRLPHFERTFRKRRGRRTLQRAPGAPGVAAVYIPRPLPPAARKSRAELGLPQDRTLYVCPMMLHKFHPDFDAAMAASCAATRARKSCYSATRAIRAATRAAAPFFRCAPTSRRDCVSCPGRT